MARAGGATEKMVLDWNGSGIERKGAGFFSDPNFACLFAELGGWGARSTLA